jgi:hypothetical protein
MTKLNVHLNIGIYLFKDNTQDKVFLVEEQKLENIIELIGTKFVSGCLADTPLLYEILSGSVLLFADDTYAVCAGNQNTEV